MALTTKSIIDRDPTLRQAVDQLQRDPQMLARVLEREAAGGLDPVRTRVLHRLRGLGIVPPRQTPEVPGGRARLGRGMLDMGQGTRQMATAAGLPPWAGGYTPEQEADVSAGIAGYERGLAAEPGRRPDALDLGRLAGNVVGALPTVLIPGAAAPAAGARAAWGAGAGATGGALQWTEGGPGQRAWNTGLGAAVGGPVGAALPPALAKMVQGGQAAGRAAGRFRQHVLPPAAARAAATRAAREAAGEVGGDVQSMASEYADELLRSGAEPTPEVLGRQLRARELGFTDEAALTAGQLSRDPNQFAREVNTAKLEGGEGLAQRFQNQRGRINELLDQNTAGLGAEGVDTPWPVGRAVTQAAEDIAEETGERVSSLYRAAQEAQPEARADAQALVDRVAAVVREYNVPQSVLARIDEVAGGGDLDAQDLVLLDKFITNSRGSDPAANRALKQLNNAVRDTMDEMGERYGGAYREAVSAARQRFAVLGRNTPKNLLPKILDGSIEPEQIASRVQAGSLAEVTQLRDLLQSQGRGEAWDEVVSRVWMDMLTRARPDESVTPSALGRMIQSLGKDADAKARLLFGDEIASRLFGTERVARDMFVSPPGAPVNTSNTSSALLNALSRMGTFPLLRNLARDPAAVREQSARDIARRALEGRLTPPLWQPLAPGAQTVTDVTASGAARLGVPQLPWLTDESR